MAITGTQHLKCKLCKLSRGWAKKCIRLVYFLIAQSQRLTMQIIIFMIIVILIIISVIIVIIILIIIFVIKAQVSKRKKKRKASLLSPALILKTTITTATTSQRKIIDSLVKLLSVFVGAVGKWDHRRNRISRVRAWGYTRHSDTCIFKNKFRSYVGREEMMTPWIKISMSPFRAC